jgi:Fe-S cluster assembly protein SufD
MSTAVAADKDRFLELIEQAGPSPQFEKLRQAARERFRALPLPSARTEDWRFTNIAPLLRVPLRLAEPTSADRSLPPAAAPSRFVFVNGVCQPHLSSVIPRLAKGIRCGHFANQSAPAELGSIADYQRHVFTALNTALLSDGFFVVVPEGESLEPIEILYLTTADAGPVAVQPRMLIIAGKHSRATIVERYLSQGEDNYFTNAVAEIVLAEDALVDHYKVQQESSKAYHLANTQVVLAGRSNFSTHYLGFGGGLVRNEVRVRFTAPSAEATVNGLYLAGGRQHVDHFTEIDHAQPNCASHELYKGILSGYAQAVFNGKIVVQPDAQKTDAKQTNKVLLLSEDATINTKPQLEIYADDVKCTHGATVGQLDADMLFYLRARGIDMESARRLLTFAFANDVVGRIKVESLRQELEQSILQ